MEFQRYAEADVPTERGPFRLVVYRFGDEEHLALVRGEDFDVFTHPERVTDGATRHVA